MIISTFDEWLLESKVSDAYVDAILTMPMFGLKKGDIVKVDALQYTQKGTTDKIDIVLPKGDKKNIEKKFLDIKI